MKVTIDGVPMSLVATINYAAKIQGKTRNALLLNLLQREFKTLETRLLEASKGSQTSEKVAYSD